MKILVLSDSHAGISFMKHVIECVKPNSVIHLGDYFEDCTTIAELYPQLQIHQVPGNCDKYRLFGIHPETLCYNICGVKIFMTHGHNHHVKSGLYSFLRDAEASGAAVALYGHTHVAYCQQEPGGMWVMNPGACGNYSGSVGLIEVSDNKITSCRILRQEDLEVL